MTEILFFSNNKNKISEIVKLFSSFPITLLNLNDFKKIKSPKEVGATFEENARIKSIYGYKFFKKICFADDSGICIDSMNGGPNVKSKDFLENNLSEKKSLENIISISKKKNNHTAYFETAISLNIDNNKSFIFKGRIKGTISKKILGTNGFGYDSIFIPQNFDKTYAQMSLNEKNLISHRSKAIKKLKDYIIENLI